MTTPDTQAPERIDTSRKNAERIMWRIHESKAGHEVRTEGFLLIEALLAERDLASAQTAAAVMQMREDALARITPAARGWPDACTNAALAAAAREIKALPLPDTTALDALIAEREDAMWRECLGALPEMGNDPVNPGWVLKTFMDNMLVLRRARASKEGR